MNINDLKQPYEPKLKNRFKVTFPESIGIPSYTVASITKPIYSAIGLTWGDMTIKLWDPIAPSVAVQLHLLIQEGLESKRTNIYEDSLFKFTIEGLDPAGITIEMWEIDVAIITGVDFGVCDSKSEKFNMITLRLRPSKCVLLY